MGYIVEVKREEQGKKASWTELASRCKNTSYHVRSGLEPQGQYRFRVRAYNTVGVSQPSMESKCVKMANASKQDSTRQSFWCFPTGGRGTRRLGEHFMLCV